MFLGLNRGIVVFLDPYPVGLRKCLWRLCQVGRDPARASSRVSKFAADQKRTALCDF
jgi:hypothetical protein